MNVLLDECPPRKLRNEIQGHEVATVPEMGWTGTKNGALLRMAAREFDVFVTADQNVQYQQNLKSVSIAVIVLVSPNNRLETLRSLIPIMLNALKTIRPGDVLRIGESSA